jgi:hypothetical protein
MDVVINLSARIFDQHVVSIKRMLQLKHEIGGYAILDTGTMKHIVKGLENDPTIPHLQIVPFFPRKPIVSWHTHYIHISNDVDGLPDGSPRCIPSNTDIDTYIQTSLKYKRSCISAVISKWGYFFIIVPDDLIEALNVEGNEEQKQRMESIHNRLKVINGIFFIENQEEACEHRIPIYIEEMKNVLTVDKQTYGFVCYMVYRYLDN